MNLKNELESVRERILWLFNKIPSTIQSDRILTDTYERLFGKALSPESITRSSRYLRAEHKFCGLNDCRIGSKRCYKRRYDMAALQDQFIEVFG